jgi:hypothetical protein
VAFDVASFSTALMPQIPVPNVASGISDTPAKGRDNENIIALRGVPVD